MTVYIFRGTSCSGKDHRINEMIRREVFAASSVISSDDYRERLFGSPYVQRFNKLLFDHMREVLTIRIKHMCGNTVWNAKNLKFKDASSTVDICNKAHVKHQFISIQPPSIGVLMARNFERYNKTRFKVPKEVLEKHLYRYEACKDRFIQEAQENHLCSFVEIDQSGTVIQNVQ